MCLKCPRRGYRAGLLGVKGDGEWKAYNSKEQLFNDLKLGSCNVTACNAFMDDYINNKNWAFETFNENGDYTLGGDMCLKCPRRGYRAGLSGVKGDGEWITYNSKEQLFNDLRLV